MAEAQKSDPRQASEMAQRFIQFVMVQAQNVLFVLGKIPTPEGVMMSPNLPAAKMLIDQLEMIQIKTQGNLSRQESMVLENALENIRMAFLEASGGTPVSMMPSRSPNIDLEELQAELDAMEQEQAHHAPPPQAAAPAPKPSTPTATTPLTPSTPSPATAKAEDEEGKKKFFKSYG